MAKARVHFEKCVVNSQEYGSDNEWMGSRVFFSLDLNGRIYDGGFVDLKQTIGSKIEEGPIEIGPPKGFSYTGPFNHESFQTEVERYYRRSVGSSGSVINLQGSKNIRMEKIGIIVPLTVEFEVSGPDAAW